jgi:hypothetical protein
MVAIHIDRSRVGAKFLGGVCILALLAQAAEAKTNCNTVRVSISPRISVPKGYNYELFIARAVRLQEWSAKGFKRVGVCGGGMYFIVYRKSIMTRPNELPTTFEESDDDEELHQSGGSATNTAS